MLKKTTPPPSQAELEQRAQALAGLTLGEIAEYWGVDIPENLTRNKGWIGLLFEHVLGASAGSRPEPDFPDLGIELKSLPINSKGKPLETTFVSVAPLTGLVGVTWQTSYVRKKLKKVLWVPVLSDKSFALKDRMVGTPFMWSASVE